MSLTNVYVLYLLNGRKYVGASEDPVKAFVAHKEGGMSAWTDRYRPEKLMRVQRGVSEDDLNTYVIRCMIQYGIENVRGGSWSTVHLTEDDRRIIRKRISEERRLNCCIQ